MPYPTEQPDLPDLATDQPVIVRPAHFNDTRREIRNIAAELGLNPSAGFPTVAARLADIEADVTAFSGAGAAAPNVVDHQWLTYAGDVALHATEWTKIIELPTKVWSARPRLLWVNFVFTRAGAGSLFMLIREGNAATITQAALPLPNNTDRYGFGAGSRQVSTFVPFPVLAADQPRAASLYVISKEEAGTIGGGTVHNGQSQKPRLQYILWEI